MSDYDYSGLKLLFHDVLAVLDRINTDPEETGIFLFYIFFMIYESVLDFAFLKKVKKNFLFCLSHDILNLSIEMHISKALVDRYGK